MKNFPRFVRTFIKPYTRTVILATVLMGLHTLLLMFIPFIMRFLLDYVIPAKDRRLLFMVLFIFIII